MVLSHLYSAILRGKWFIRLQDVEASGLILQQVLDGSNPKTAEEKAAQVADGTDGIFQEPV